MCVSSGRRFRERFSQNNDQCRHGIVLHTHTHTHTLTLTHAHMHTHTLLSTSLPLPTLPSHRLTQCMHIYTLQYTHPCTHIHLPRFIHAYMHTCIRLSFQTCINTHIHAYEDISIIMQCTRLASNKLILILCCCAYALTYTHSFIHSLTHTHTLTHSLTHWQKNVRCAHVYTLIDFLSQQLYSIWSHPLGIYEYLFNLISPTG